MSIKTWIFDIWFMKKILKFFCSEVNYKSTMKESVQCIRNKNVRLQDHIHKILHKTVILGI